MKDAITDEAFVIHQPEKFVYQDAAGITWEDDATEADVKPGDSGRHGNNIKDYWIHGKGLAKWANDPHPWTALYHHLIKFMPPEMAKRTAAQWHHDVFGIWPGEKKGKNPAGPG